ncbi:MAG: SPOR domain-containing protein [Bacteroidales bacterium]|nr:SPOR domain-containing protein [Bacteroidales bacterium]
MSKVSVFIALTVLALAVSSCDFFRTLAGRPVSAEIAAKRARIESAEARKAAYRDSVIQARLDSAARAERCIADSLYATDTLSSNGLLRKASTIKGVSRKSLDHRFYVVAGAFSQQANAERLAARYADAGVQSMVVSRFGHLNAVLLAPCDKIADALDAYRQVKSLPFASRQSWILVNE